MLSIVKTIHGSHLFGLNTPKSDIDYREIFLPSLDKVILGTFKNVIDHKIEKDDIVQYSVHKFVDLACSGQTAAIEMLYTPDNFIIYETDIWKSFKLNRHRFLSKNINAFMGFAKAQSEKYFIKTNRYNMLYEASTRLETHNRLFPDNTLNDVWDFLPENDYVYKSKDKNENDIYIIGNIKLMKRERIDDTISRIKNMISEYGKRINSNISTGMVDWKAISHALRVVFEVEEILRDNTLTLPLPNNVREIVMKVKMGELDINYISDIIAEHTNTVNNLLEKSNLPENIDKIFWHNFVVDLYKNVYNLSI